MSPDVPTMKCRKCRAPILWETIAGMRLGMVKPKGTKPIYKTRCECGDVKRDKQGRRVR